MKITYIKVDTELADEYCKKYRRLFPSDKDKELNNNLLIEAFLSDRLREELEFINDEIEDSESEI